MTRRSACSILALLAGAAVCHAQSLHLILDSPPGDWVGEGQNWDVTYTGATNVEVAHMYDRANDPWPDQVELDGFLAVGSLPLEIIFATDKLGIPFTPGLSYGNAERQVVAAQGHPGEDITFDYHGYSNLVGAFSINQIDYHAVSGGWTLDDFSASFLIDGDNESSPITGSVYFSAAPEPLSIAGLSFGCLALLARRRR